MTSLDIFINVFFAALTLLSWLLYRFLPTYIKVKPTLLERYKQWRLERYWQKQEVKK